jgi:hypothetical protein
MADLQAKGAPTSFSVDNYRKALISECGFVTSGGECLRACVRRINEARTGPKMYVKKLMKLKECFTGKVAHLVVVRV